MNYGVILMRRFFPGASITIGIRYVLVYALICMLMYAYVYNHGVARRQISLVTFFGYDITIHRVATCHSFCVIVPHFANFPAFRIDFMHDAICPAILLSFKFNILVI